MIKQFQWIMKQSRLGVYSDIKNEHLWAMNQWVLAIHCMYTSLGICMAMSKSLSTKSSGLLNHLDQYKWAWYPLFAHVFNHHEILWLPDTVVYRSCHDDVDVMISLLFTMAICVSLFEMFSCGFCKSLRYKVQPFLFDVMQCSVTLHSLTTEVHQVLCCSLQAS